MNGKPRIMADPGAFFSALRKLTGPLNQVQVDTVNGLLASAAQWPTSWLAYGLANAWHEAGFEPVAGIGNGRGKAYGKHGPYVQTQHARGLRQRPWDSAEDRPVGAAGVTKG